MRFLLQQGHGMMTLDREFIENDFASGIILSPRVYTREQVENHASEIHELAGDVLFDPQFYVPRTAREKIVNYPYWKGIKFSTSGFKAAEAQKFVEKAIKYQVENLDVAEVILPGRFTNSISEDWLELQSLFAQVGKSLVTDRPVLSTLAIGSDVVLNQNAFNDVIDEMVSYPVDGFYVVAQSPREFLVSNELFLYSMLDGLLSIVLSSKKVVLGYSNQQALIFLAAGVTDMASGNFRNVRSFNPQIFDIQEPLEQQRAIWYYDAQSLSEFRINALALAFRRGLRSLFGPRCQYCVELLDAVNPMDIGWSERDAFRHCLYEVQRQWLSLQRISTDLRAEAILELLSNVEENLRALRSRGFDLGTRAFYGCLESSRAAVSAFMHDRANDISSLE